MNCDHAFDAITDPARFDDAALQHHLAQCPRCRALQQVLEPALDLVCGDLPQEQGTVGAFPPAAHRPVLSVEAVRMAEAVARQLTTTTAARRAAGFAKPTKRRALVALLRGAALTALGGLIVFSIGVWSREPGSNISPSAVPPRGPSRSCTRNDFPADRQGPVEARSVVLTCVACHAKDRERPKQPLSSSFLWGSPRSAGPILLCDEAAGGMGGERSRAIASNTHFPSLGLLAGSRLAADRQFGYSSHA